MRGPVRGQRATEPVGWWWLLAPRLVESGADPGLLVSPALGFSRAALPGLPAIGDGADRRAAYAPGMSPTVFRDGPFRFFFFSREETRMHVHVQSADGEAKVWIEPAIELARNYGLSDQDLSRVLQLVVDHEQEIRDAWRSHFGI
jgi:hypothetical protein